MISEHPLAGDLSELSEDELLTKINELWNKMGMARRTGNAHLVNQISMMITAYQTAYNNKLQKDDQIPFTSVIDIS